MDSVSYKQRVLKSKEREKAGESHACLHSEGTWSIAKETARACERVVKITIKIAHSFCIQNTPRNTPNYN